MPVRNLAEPAGQYAAFVHCEAEAPHWYACREIVCPAADARRNHDRNCTNLAHYLACRMCECVTAVAIIRADGDIGTDHKDIDQCVGRNHSDDEIGRAHV